MTLDELCAGINLYCERDLSIDTAEKIVCIFRKILHVGTDTSVYAVNTIKNELNKIVDILVNKGGISDSKGIQRALNGILELLFTSIKEEFVEFTMDLWEENTDE